MRVLLANYLYKPHVGGVENSVFYIGKTLREMGHDVTIFCSDRGLSLADPLPEYEVLDGVSVVRFKENRSRNFLSAIFDTSKNIGIARKKACAMASFSGFELIIARDYRMVLAFKGTSALNAKCIYLLPSFVSNLDRLVVSKTERIDRKIKTWLTNLLVIKQLERMQCAAIKSADFNVVFSDVMQRQFLDFVGSGCQVVKFTPGVDGVRFELANNALRERWRRKFGVNDRDVVLLGLGRLISAKGYEQAIRSIAKSQRDNLKFFVVGDGPEKGSLKKLAAELEVLDRVKFYNATNNPEHFYWLADAFVMTSSYESFGQTILEAMSCGLAILGYESDYEHGVETATSEFIVHMVNGFLVNRSESDFNEAIEMYFCLDAVDRLAMRLRNSEIVRNQYSWKSLSSGLMDLHFANSAVNGG